MTTEIGYRGVGVHLFCVLKIERELRSQMEGCVKGKGSVVVKCRSEKHPRRAQGGRRAGPLQSLDQCTTRTAADAGYTSASVYLSVSHLIKHISDEKRG